MMFTFVRIGFLEATLVIVARSREGALTYLAAIVTDPSEWTEVKR